MFTQLADFIGASAELDRLIGGKIQNLNAFTIFRDLDFDIVNLAVDLDDALVSHDPCNLRAIHKTKQANRTNRQSDQQCGNELPESAGRFEADFFSNDVGVG